MSVPRSIFPPAVFGIFIEQRAAPFTMRPDTGVDTAPAFALQVTVPDAKGTPSLRVTGADTVNLFPATGFVAATGLPTVTDTAATGFVAATGLPSAQERLKERSA